MGSSVMCEFFPWFTAIGRVSFGDAIHHFLGARSFALMSRSVRTAQLWLGM